MTQYKLFYTKVKGRAELIRLIFAAAGQEFYDARFDYSEWPAYKPLAPLGQMPYLEITEGDKTIVVSQSISIARFLAKRFGLYGKDDVEQVYADMYADQVSDVYNELVHFYFHERDETRKNELETKYNAESLPKNLAFFEKRLAENKGHLAGESLTYADLHLFAWLEWLGDKRDSILESYPTIKGLVDEIKNHARIAAYLAKRPVSDI